VSRPRVHVTGRIPDAIGSALRADFELAPGPEGVDGIVPLLTTTVDDAYLERAGPRLKVIANYAVGVNNIDLEAARARGIVVTNTPDVLTHTVAELAVGLLLSLLRRIAEGDRLIRAATPWEVDLEFMLGTSLHEKLVAIVGPGRIGRETARLFEALGARIILVGRSDSLTEALAQADVVSLHLPLTDETHHLIDESALASMRSEAILINTARGPIVDENALIRALSAGTIAGAALDVFEFEPAVTEDLRTFENVVLTPHLGSATRTTREAMGMLAVDSLRAVLLENRSPVNAV
jgi:glyoxylate reductase